MLFLGLEATDGGIYEHSIPPEEITYLSKQQANILGYHLDEVPSYHCFTEWLVEQVHPVDRDPLDRAYRDFVAGRAAT
jgi:hypothetical protein